MSARVLITGGAGYLGSVFSERLLAAGYSVTVLDNLTYGQHSLFHLCRDPGFDFVFGDARDEPLLKDLLTTADIILPLAAIVGAPACDRDPALARSVNLEGVRTLLRLRSPSQLVVFPNTNSGYGTKSPIELCTEETPLEPISLYGQSKVQAETEVLAAPNTIALRLATVFGMSPRLRLDLLVNHFVYAAVTDGYIILFEKDYKRSCVHIDDVSECFLHCIAHHEEMVGNAYNLSLGSANLSKEQIALTVQRFVPRFHIRCSELGSDPDQRNYIVSSERLRCAGFEASRSLEQGIQELLKGVRMLGRAPFKNV